MDSRLATFFIHVLVVEDDADHRNDLRTLLIDAGHRMDVAADGLDAVKKVVALDPDVVLMDLGMPVMDGWTAIREIRRRASKNRPYVIALSAHAHAHARKEAFYAGCNEYIVKPLDVRGALRAYAWRRSHGKPQ